MKKILAFLCALVLVLSLCACSSSTADTSTEAAETDTTDTAEVAEAAEATETEDAAEAEETGLETAVAGTLTMATNAEFPPYEYYEGDEVVGIDAEIAAAIAEKLGLELDIQDMAFDSIIPAITSGKADVGLAGMTVTEERQQSVDFSDSYATGVQVIIVTEDSPITCADDGNYTIGVQNATTGDLYCTWDIEDEGLGTVQRYNKGADAVQALITGKVDCVVIDNEPAKAFVAANEGLTILDTEYVTEDYAIALAKDSSLTEPVNAALQELIADGTVQSILDKYIGD
jgi:polar amino acid transport system substrate-binding protein